MKRLNSCLRNTCKAGRTRIHVYFPLVTLAFKKKMIETSRKLGIHITAKSLRDFFSSELGESGVPDRYVDVFQGRTPKKILARHYTDYKPERLKAIYDKADLKVLS
jgi:intergrase/recombinase